PIEGVIVLDPPGLPAGGNPGEIGHRPNAPIPCGRARDYWPLVPEESQVAKNRNQDGILGRKAPGVLLRRRPRPRWSKEVAQHASFSVGACCEAKPVAAGGQGHREPVTLFVR